MEILTAIFATAITGLFCALWIVLLARLGLFPVALIQVMPMKESDVDD